MQHIVRTFMLLILQSHVFHQWPLSESNQSNQSCWYSPYRFSVRVKVQRLQSIQPRKPQSQYSHLQKSPDVGRNR